MLWFVDPPSELGKPPLTEWLIFGYSFEAIRNQLPAKIVLQFKHMFFTPLFPESIYLPTYLSIYLSTYLSAILNIYMRLIILVPVIVEIPLGKSPGRLASNSTSGTDLRTHGAQPRASGAPIPSRGAGRDSKKWWGKRKRSINFKHGEYK